MGPGEGIPGAIAVPKKKKPLQSVDYQLRKTKSHIRKGLQITRPEPLDNARRQADNIKDQVRREQVSDRLDRIEKTHAKFNNEIDRLEEAAENRGDKKMVAFIGAERERAENNRSSKVDKLIGAGEALIGVLDASHKYLIRSRTTPHRDTDKPGDDIVSSQEWAKRVKEDAKAGKPVASTVRGVAKVAAAIPATALAAVTGAAGVATDLVAGRKVSMENLKKLLSETHEDMTDFLLIEATDPLTYLSVGQAGAAKNAMSTTAKAMKLAVKAKKISKADAASLVSRIGAIAGDHAGTAKAMPRVMQAFENSAGGLRATDAAALFGKKGEFLGESQMALRLPFADSIKNWTGKLPEVSLNKLAGGQDYAAAKATQKVFDKTLRPVLTGGLGKRLKLGRDPDKGLFDPTKRHLKAEKRIGRGAAKIAEERLLNGLERVAELAPKARTRRGWIVKNIIDPAKPPTKEMLASVTADERKWVEALDGLFKEAHDTGVSAGYFAKKQIGANEHTGRYFPRQIKREWGALEDLPAARKDILDRRSPAKARSRVKDFPIGGLTSVDETVEAADALRAAKKSGDTSQIAQAQKLSDDLDARFKKQTISAEFDPHVAVPRYMQQVGRGVGVGTLEKNVLESFGMAPAKFADKKVFDAYIAKQEKIIAKAKLKGGPGERKETVKAFFEKKEAYALRQRWLDSGLKTSDVHPTLGGYSVVDGQVVTHEVANFLNDSFSGAGSTFSKWMADTPGAKTPAGRAAREVFNLWRTTANQWKRNVLVTRPGYHVLNGWNDSLQMVSDGNLSAALWLKKSRQWLKGSKRGANMIQEGTGRIYKPQEIIGLARKNGLPVDAGTAAARLEQIGDAGASAKYERYQRASVRGSKTGVKSSPEVLSALGRRQVRRDAVKDATTTAALDYSGAIPLAFGIPSLAQKHGDKVAVAWESRAKLAHFAWRLSKGDSPALAAERSLKTLFDYQDPGRVAQVMRWFLPFATWLAKAPGFTARTAAKNPAALIGVPRFFQSMEGKVDDEDMITPSPRVSMRSSTYRLGDRGTQTAENLRYIGRRIASPFTGESADRSREGASAEGQAAVWHPRATGDESLNMWGEMAGIGSLARGEGWEPNLEPAISALAPGWKAFVEYLTQKEAQSGRDLPRPTPLSMFPPKTPGPIPDFLRADIGQNPWFTRYAAPRFLTPGLVALANEALYREGGGEEGRAPLASVGSFRDYAPEGQAENRFATGMVNAATGLPQYVSDPAGYFGYRAGELEEMRKKLFKARRDSEQAEEAVYRRMVREEEGK
jgi:hypothetical protein